MSQEAPIPPALSCEAAQPNHGHPNMHPFRVINFALCVAELHWNKDTAMPRKSQRSLHIVKKQLVCIFIVFFMIWFSGGQRTKEVTGSRRTKVVTGGRQKNRVKTCKILLLNWSQNWVSMPPPFVPPSRTALHAWPAFWNTVLVVLNMTIFTTFSQTRTIGHCVRFVLTISHIGVNCAKYAAYWYRNMFSIPLYFVWHFKGIERTFPILLNMKDKHITMGMSLLSYLEADISRQSFDFGWVQVVE